MPKVQVPQHAALVVSGTNEADQLVAMFITTENDGVIRAFVRLGDDTWSTRKADVRRRILKDILELAAEGSIGLKYSNSKIIKRAEA
jgi:hypothetical protein